jgi:hypothetical protein
VTIRRGLVIGRGGTLGFAWSAVALREIERALDWDGWARIEVRPEVQAAYVSEVQAALPGTAYNASACHSYYIDANGRNSFSWPWSTNESVRLVSRFDAADVDTTAHVTAESLS